MGGIAHWSGFSVKMFGLWPSDYDRAETRGKKCEGNQGKALKKGTGYDIITSRDIFLAGELYPAIPCFSEPGEARDHKEVKQA